MKSVVDLWYVRSWDIFKNIYQIGFISSEPEAIAWQALTDSFTGGESDRTHMYIGINKYLMQQWLSDIANQYHLGLEVSYGTTVVSRPPCYLTKAEVDGWGIDHKDWITDTQDPASVKNTLVAEKIIKQTSKAGDFSGAAGLLAAANGLLAYADALRKAGRKRDAGIVQFAYDQIFSGQWSITEAFDFLRRNNL